MKMEQHVIKYLERLVKKVWKILPMQEEGCSTLDLYISSLSREIMGSSILFFSEEMIAVASTLNGMDIQNHKSLKSDVFKATRILDSTKKRVKKEWT